MKAIAIQDVSLQSSTPEYVLGTVASSNDGNYYQYVKAGEAYTQYACGLIDEDYTIVMATTTTSAPGAGQGKAVGVPQIALTSGYYGWALVKGTGSVLGAASCVKFTELNTTATAGTLDDDATSGAEVISGIVFDTTLTDAAATSAVINYPLVGRTLA
jgi:hypothetical protein